MSEREKQKLFFFNNNTAPKYYSPYEYIVLVAMICILICVYSRYWHSRKMRKVFIVCYFFDLFELCFVCSKANTTMQFDDGHLFISNLSSPASWQFECKLYATQSQCSLRSDASRWTAFFLFVWGFFYLVLGEWGYVVVQTTITVRISLCWCMVMHKMGLELVVCTEGRRAMPG